MCVKLFWETIKMEKNCPKEINPFEPCEIAWFLWQRILRFLRMGMSLQKYLYLSSNSSETFKLGTN